MKSNTVFRTCKLGEVKPPGEVGWMLDGTVGLVEE